MLPPTVKKTQEEIDRFLTMNEIKFDAFETNKSFLTNILIAGKNFTYLFRYLATTLSFLKNVYLVLDPDVLAQDVLESIATSKHQLNILASQNAGTSRTQTFGTVNQKIYKITRVDDYRITITMDNSVGNEWFVDGLIVQVKSVNDGEIVHPKITTINDKIEVYFHDKISRNYYLIFI